MGKRDRLKLDPETIRRVCEAIETEADCSPVQARSIAGRVLAELLGEHQVMVWDNMTTSNF